MDSERPVASLWPLLWFVLLAIILYLFLSWRLGR